ncbi:hypothetical protein [Clavibacter capsici]|uniref:hypothetical protein n=1 Tax=Clavibacter capsici TaxID=1874630 RepID=UPI0014285CC5|nr:hypothetical protein [Clavibacter capsici]QIS38614.1 hypothetical protein GW572_04365 [Clavibacter capsici]
MADIDSTDLFKLAADLGEAPDNIAPYLGKAIGVTSLKIKQTWASKVGSGLNAALPRAIDYTVKGASDRGGSSIESEIGFNKGRRAGALGNISEYGTLFHPPRGFGAASLQENEADFEKGIDAAVADALKAVGL